MTEPDKPWSKITRDRWFYLALTASLVSVVVLFWPYLYVLMFAAVTVVVCWPVYSWLLARLGGRQMLASVLTTLLLALLVFGPLALILVLFALEAQSVISQAIEFVQSGALQVLLEDVLAQLEPPEWLARFLPELPDMPETSFLEEIGPGTSLEPLPETAAVPELADRMVRIAAEGQGAQVFAPMWGTLVHEAADREALRLAAEATPGGGLDLWLARLSLIEEDLWSSAQNATLSALRFAGSGIPGAIQAVVNLSIDSVIYVFAVITLFTTGPRLLVTAKRLSPLDDRYEERLFAVFGEFSRNLVVGSVATAAIQGIIASIGYAISGVGNVLFLAILTGVGSFVPVVGTPVVWVPVVGYLAFQGHYGMAVFLTIWSLVLVGSIDNVLKPLFMRGNTDIHPLLVFLAVFGGLYWMGLSGLFVGPVLVAFFLALYTIYEIDFLGIVEEEVEEPEPGFMARLLARGLSVVGLGQAAETVEDAATPDPGTVLDRPDEPIVSDAGPTEGVRERPEADYTSDDVVGEHVPGEDDTPDDDDDADAATGSGSPS